MKELDVLRKEIETRIEQLKKDKNIDNSKRAVLIKENNKFLVRVQQLGLPYLGKSLPMEREQDKSDNFDRLKEQYKKSLEKQTIDSWSSNKMYYDAMRLFCLDTQLISFNDIELMENEINLIQ